MKSNDAAIRKRTQISKANRTMFLWIAISSALIGAAIVVSIFLTQKLIYTEKVLGAKQETVSVLDHNNEIVPSLEDEIRVLDTNTALNSIKANETDQAIQVILDALPSEANSLALGASLQNKLLVGIPNLAIESLQVDSVIGVETLTSAAEAEADPTITGDAASASAITFRFTVTGPEQSLKKALENLERSIRTIQIVSVKIESRSTGTSMVVQAKAYYEPTKTIQLTQKEIKP